MNATLPPSLHPPLKFFPCFRVQNVFWLYPTPARLTDAEAKIDVARMVRVTVDREQHAEFFGAFRMHIVQIHPFDRCIDLHRNVMLCGSLQHSLHVVLDGITFEDESRSRMRDDVDERMLDGTDDALRHGGG